MTSFAPLSTTPLSTQPSAILSISGSPQADTATSSGSGNVFIVADGSPQADAATASIDGGPVAEASGSPQAQLATILSDTKVVVGVSGTPQAVRAMGTGDFKALVGISGTPQAQVATSTGQSDALIDLSGAPQAQIATADGGVDPLAQASGFPQAQLATITSTFQVPVGINGAPQANTATSSAAVTKLSPVRAVDQRIYLIEFDHHDGNGVLTTYLTDADWYRSATTDSPASQFYEPRIITPGNFEVTAFEPGRTFGNATVSQGDMIAQNMDGFFDGQLNHGHDGRDFKILRVGDREEKRANAKRMFTGTMQQAVGDTAEFRVILRDKLEILRDDIQDTVYAGTTTDGTKKNAEGDEELEDQIKPLLYGNTPNVPALNADRFNLVRQVSENEVHDITAVYDKAVPLRDPDINWGTLSDLYNASIQSARFHTAHSLGLFRLGAQPAGTITADVLEGSTASDRTAAQVAKRILKDQGGLTDSDLIDSSFTNLDNKNSSEVGIYIGEQTTVLRAVSDVLKSIGAFITVTQLGKFAVYRLELPTGSDPVAGEFNEDLLLRDDDLERLPTGDQGNGVPAWKVTLRYNRNWTVQREDALAGFAQDCISDQRKEFLTREWREVVKKNSSVKTQFKKAPSLTFDTLLVNRGAAETEAQRRLDIYEKKRERYRFTVKAAFAEDIRMNDTIKLTFNRFGLSNGKLFKVIGIAYDYQRDAFTIDAWGGV